MIRRAGAVLLVLVLIGGLVWVAWRWQLQTVDVVIVNASGVEAEFTWQPQLFAAEASVVVRGCESKSIQLLAGEEWRLVADKLDISSSVVDVPLAARAVAVEVWLDPDGGSRLVRAYPVDGPVSAPDPGCGSVPGPSPSDLPAESSAPGVAIDCGPIVDRALCLDAVEVAATAKINPSPVARATIRRPEPGDACTTAFHRCDQASVVVELQSGDTIQAVPLIRSTGGWVRLDEVR